MSDDRKGKAQVSALARNTVQKLIEGEYPDAHKRQVVIRKIHLWLITRHAFNNPDNLWKLAVQLFHGMDHTFHVMHTLATFPQILTNYPHITRGYLSKAIHARHIRLIRLLLQLGLHPGQPEQGQHNPMIQSIVCYHFDAALAILHDPRCTIHEYEAKIHRYSQYTTSVDLALSRRTSIRVLQRISVFWMLVHGVRLPQVPWLPRDCLRLLITFL
jgi:hypothetical protein